MIFAAVWVGVLWISGLYRLDVRWNVSTEIRDVARATLLVVAITLSALFLLKHEDVSRLFLTMLFVIQPTVTLVSRLILRAAFTWNRAAWSRSAVHARGRDRAAGPGLRRSR